MSVFLFAFGLNEASTLIKVSFCENLFSLLNALVRLFLVSQAPHRSASMSMSLHRLGEESRPLIGQCQPSGLLIGRKLHP